jgi:hypothetical protein
LTRFFAALRFRFFGLLAVFFDEMLILPDFATLMV